MESLCVLYDVRDVVLCLSQQTSKHEQLFFVSVDYVFGIDLRQCISI